MNPVLAAAQHLCDGRQHISKCCGT